LCLNLNDALSLMFMMPTLVTMTITATRMYRLLADFCSCTEVEVGSSIVRRSGRHIPHANLCTHELEVAVRTTYGYKSYPTSTGDKDISFISVEELERDKPLELGPHVNAESNNV